MIVLGDDVGFSEVSSNAVPPRTSKSQVETFTPNIDQLASDGVSLTRFYSASSVCTPTRASIMTARFPFHEDVAMHNALSGDEPYRASFGSAPYLGSESRDMTMLTSFFSAKGWRVGAFGKWHLGTIDSPGPGWARYGVHDFKCFLCGLTPREKMYEEPRVGFSAIASRMIVDDSIAFLERTFSSNRDASSTSSPARETRALLYVALHAAHQPTNLLDAQFDALGYPHAANPYDDGGTASLATFPYLVREKPHQIRAAILFDMDYHVGRLLAWIDERGLREDSIVVWTSDNGPAHAAEYFANVADTSPHRGGKRTVREGGIHVPFLIRWGSRLRAGSRIDALAGSVDVFPTLAAMAGYDLATDAPDASRMDGVDLTPCIVGNDCARSRSRFLVFEHRSTQVGADCVDTAPRYAVSAGASGLKLYAHSRRSVPPAHDTFSNLELFNVLADPMETIDLLDPARITEDASREAAALERVLREYPFYGKRRWSADGIENKYNTHESKDLFVGFTCDSLNWLKSAGGGE